jgi:glycyl-tRNA synthetase beta chain
MTKTNDFLIEIGTEELPPNSLQQLSSSLAQNLQKGLRKASLDYGEANIYATPRRLAVLIKDLIDKQPNQTIKRRGPSWQAAFDKDGAVTKAALSFANSCGVSVEQLQKIETAKGVWVACKKTQTGDKTITLLPSIVKEAIRTLPIPRPMRWNSGELEFVQPVHWVVLMYGNGVVKTTIFALETCRETYGHRFHCKKKILITEPSKYEQILDQKGFVIADFAKRKSVICKQIEKIASKYGKPQIDESLLDEVTGLVEWPVALLGAFAEHFLRLPQEVLILSLQKRQKCFPLFDNKNKLLPYFITICNIKSKNPKRVAKGNERVINARLSDAEFFYGTDLKQSLESRLNQLKNIIFQAKLGSLYDKTMRVTKLAEHISKLIGADPKQAERAAALAKTDLVTEMVKEFPELQGVMGFYYAKFYKEPKEVAISLREQYLPRFAGDELPKTKIGQALAIADRIDTLVGSFGINQAPSGDKDPYGLRRAALGVLRIIIEKKLNLSLDELIKQSQKIYDYHFERCYPGGWVINVKKILAAVCARSHYDPLETNKRVEAVRAFLKLPEAESLSIAFKRVRNILKEGLAECSTQEEKEEIGFGEIDNTLLKEKAERDLAKQITEHQEEVKSLYERKEYTKALTTLAKLKQPIDKFFDTVMVMTDDKELRNNRLTLLQKLENLFLHVADISLLQT